MRVQPAGMTRNSVRITVFLQTVTYINTAIPHNCGRMASLRATGPQYISKYTVAHLAAKTGAVNGGNSYRVMYW